MSNRIVEEIATLEVMEPATVGSLRVFGLRRSAEAAVDYITIDEALQAHALVITEVGETGQVPTLVATTSADTMVFFLAGEELIGAKQNRVINKSLMLPARDQVKIPVCCVEQGRWHRQSREFRSGGSVSHGRLRERMHKDIHDSYRREAAPVPRQSEVWNEVERKMEALQCASPSSALHQAYEDYASRLGDMVTEIPVPKDCCGVVFAVGNRLAGIDVFDRPSTLARFWPKLTRAYALDALEEEPVAPPSEGKADVERRLRSLRDAVVEQYDSPGVGHDLRFRTRDLVGSALIVDGALVHAELFGADDEA